MSEAELPEVDPEVRCPLCKSAMGVHRDVCIQTGGTSVFGYSLAWVCTNCSAAFPIAQEYKGDGWFKMRAGPVHDLPDGADGN